MISSKGVVISQEQNPTISNRGVESGNGGGNYTTSVTGLEPLTTYYIRAYVISSGVTSYGNQLAITTGNYDIPVDGNQDRI